MSPDDRLHLNGFLPKVGVESAIAKALENGVVEGRPNPARNRHRAWTQPLPRYRTVVLAKYAALTTSASEGAATG